MLDVNERLNSIVGEGGEVLIAILVKKKKIILANATDGKDTSDRRSVKTVGTFRRFS
jgi:hypothetical protein